MPGIAGIISRQPRGRKEHDLGLMVDSMLHEPFYVSGKYVDERLGLYVGWVCHEDSFSDCMPVVNEAGDLVLIFAGESYADSGLTDELKKGGHDTNLSNASYLIHLYEEHGERFLRSLNGWFSGVLVDLREGKVILFNDRFGMHRVYYHEGKSDFLFASEAKALLKVRPELRSLDMRSLGEFFACDCVLENRSLFTNVFALPGGSAWTFRDASDIKKDCYFSPREWEEQPVLEKEVFYGRLRETFLNVLPRHFAGNRTIGMSLTSGLDTRVIMSNIDNGPGRLPCYTFSGIDRDTLDVQIARKVAKECGREHHVIRLDSTFLSDFPAHAERTVYLTDGCHDICGTHDVFYNGFARELAPVRMTGKFGSEILASNSMLKKAVNYEAELFQPEFKPRLDDAADTLAECKRGPRLSFAVFKEMPWHEYSRVAIEMSKVTLRTPYMDNDLVGLMYQASPETRDSSEIRLRLIEDGNPALRGIMTDRGTALRTNGVVSKMAQMFFYSLFKAEYAYLYQMPHWLSVIDSKVKALRLERLILGRYQLGRYRLWFGNELSEYIRDILLDKRTAARPYFNKGVMEKVVTGHIDGGRNYINEINKALTTELIQRLLIEQN